MVTARIIAAGAIKQSEGYFRDACGEYIKRLSRFCRVEIKELPESAPAAEFIKQLSDRAYKIALCVEGRQYSSSEFAAFISDAAERGGSRIDFVIGGPDGLDEEVKAACDLRLSFSQMTFPHRLMRVLLTEQLYRAFTINHGLKYDR
ncbi:MAG: 23S rRNA (pseudouridine(1915)-N(3))-methyltransferase RlmH [Clostridiales bacterium]|nr:23S rRNA (pseudouridine(1915)-N(3))-methyltransferase RlmH [Clostridiales bacterium]